MLGRISRHTICLQDILSVKQSLLPDYFLPCDQQDMQCNNNMVVGINANPLACLTLNDPRFALPIAVRNPCTTTMSSGLPADTAAHGDI